MTLTLLITAELAWRTETLDAVSHVAEFELHENTTFKGLYELAAGESKPIKLTNDEFIYVWAALTSSNHYVFHVEHNKNKLINLKTESQFYLEAYMPDHQLYQFAIITKS